MSGILYSSQLKYLKKFKKEDDLLIVQMENYAKKNEIPILAWNSAVFLEQLIQISRPKHVLELGTAIAYSTIRIARNLGKNNIIDTIEKSKDNFKQATKNVKKSRLGKKINLLFGDALDIMPKLKNKYDFIFLDADKGDYNKLFNYSIILLKKDGILFVDNLLWHGYAAVSRVPPAQKILANNIREFNQIFTSHPNLNATILSIGDGIGLGVKLR